MPLLTEQDIAFFRVTGYVIKRGAVEADLITECRDRIWNNIPEDRDKPDEWTPGSHYSSYRIKEEKHWANTGPFQVLAEHESLWGVAKQLLGEKLHPAAPGSVLLRFPNPGAEYNPPTEGHLDNTCGHSFNTITILDTIKPRGGGFTIWPGSHLMCHEYFRQHDVHEDLNLKQGANGGRLPWVTGTGVEFHGEPGDVCYIHPWMVHTVGHNIQDNVRMVAQIGYFRSTLEDDYREVPDDMWWFWDGMNDIERTMRAEGRDWYFPRNEEALAEGVAY